MVRFIPKSILLALATLAVTAADICEQDEGDCIAASKACTHAPGDCCPGFECHGYNFFKRCQETPVCLDMWYACNGDDAIQCCNGLTCVQTHPGIHECQKPTIEGRTTELPGFNAQQPNPPNPSTNTNTIQCDEPTVHEACLTGDPHLRTFDGLTYDCHGVGEHVVFKSKHTSRQVQGRFTRVGDRDVTSTYAVAIQDEGGVESPVVQISIPVEDEGEATPLGNNGCRLQLFVDGQQHPLVKYANDGFSYESDQVTVRLDGGKVTTTYKSGFKSTVTIGYWNGCLLNNCFEVPTCEGQDELTGLFGDADGDALNDWIGKDDSRIPIPESNTDRRRKPAYDFCVPNWCITNEDDSIFFYNEVGYTFGHYSRCALEYGDSLVEFIEDLPANIVRACAGDVGCMIDALNVDGDQQDDGAAEAAVRQNILAKQGIIDQCSKENGDCSGNFRCCDGYNCIPFAPTDWRCKSDIASLTELDPQCNPVEFGYCDKVPCCGDMECVQKVGGNDEHSWQCQVATMAECVEETRRCTSDDSCCGDDLSCVNPRLGRNAEHKTCMKLPTPCSGEHQICFPGQECCDGHYCNDGACEKIVPLSWGQTCNDGPEEKKCIDGLVCVPWRSRKVCADPGVKMAADGTWCLKKGAICALDNDDVTCEEGTTCQTPSEAQQKKLVEQFGEEEAKRYGQCRDADIENTKEESEDSDDE